MSLMNFFGKVGSGKDFWDKMDSYSQGKTIDKDRAKEFVGVLWFDLFHLRLEAP